MKSRLRQIRKRAAGWWVVKNAGLRLRVSNILRKIGVLSGRISDHITQMRKRAIKYWAVRIVQWRLRASYILRRSSECVGYAVISLFGIATSAVIILCPQLRNVIDAFRPLETILSQLGATFGTILALVLTLSIIPIQRAGEVWSPSIVRLYRRDPVTHVTFIALGSFCLASFLLAVRGLADMSVSIVLASALVVLGMSMDLLRWYHRHVCRLLDPTHACQIALRQVNRTINRISALVTSVAKIQYKILESDQRKKIGVEDIETTIYPQVAGYPNAINAWINDLAEIATKAVARGERHLAKIAVFAIANVANHYLCVRKQNMVVVLARAALFFGTESDTKVVMDCVYEALKEVSRAAVAQSDESTAIRVSEAYQAIAIYTANLGARAFRKHTAPLTHVPIFYTLDCVKYAQTKGLDEVPFQTAAIVAGIAIYAPKDIAEVDINVPIIDGLYDIAAYFYGKRSFGLAEEVNNHQFTILARMIERKDYYFKDTLRHVLEKIELLAPLAILNEAIVGQLSVVHPLGKVYGLVNPDSLGHLFAKAAEVLPKIDVGREWLNPYDDLVDITDVISNHLRQIAEKNEFGESFLMWEIDQLIKHIAKVIVSLIDHPLRSGRGDEKKLVEKFGWIMSFYWVAFKGKKSVSGRHADDCGESLVFIGLLFYKRGYSEVLRDSISSIRSILESYCEIAKWPDYYAIGDILAHLWCFRMLLVARDNSELVKEVDQALATKPRALSDEQWKGAQDAILLRRSQLEARLKAWENHLQPDDAEVLLRRLLAETPEKPS